MPPDIKCGVIAASAARVYVALPFMGNSDFMAGASGGGRYCAGQSLRGRGGRPLIVAAGANARCQRVFRKLMCCFPER